MKKNNVDPIYKNLLYVKKVYIFLLVSFFRWVGGYQPTHHIFKWNFPSIYKYKREQS